MPGRIPAFPPEHLSDDARALYKSIAGGRRAQGTQHFALTRSDGSLRGPFNAFLLAPALGSELQDLGAAIRYRGALSDRGREIAILLVAAHWDSAFEREAHEAVGRAAGLTEDEIAALRRADISIFGGDDALVAGVTAQLVDGDLDDETWSAASAALGEDVIFELSTLVGYYATLALQLRVFRVV